jgi:hypothetical protein
VPQDGVEKFWREEIPSRMMVGTETRLKIELRADNT